MRWVYCCHTVSVTSQIWVLNLNGTNLLFQPHDVRPNGSPWGTQQTDPHSASDLDIPISTWCRRRGNGAVVREPRNLFEERQKRAGSHVQTRLLFSENWLPSKSWKIQWSLVRYIHVGSRKIGREKTEEKPLWLYDTLLVRSYLHGFNLQRFGMVECWRQIRKSKHRETAPKVKATSIVQGCSPLCVFKSAGCSSFNGWGVVEDWQWWQYPSKSSNTNNLNAVSVGWSPFLDHEQTPDCFISNLKNFFSHVA